MSDFDRNPSSWQTPGTVDRLQRLGLMVGGVGAVLLAVGFFTNAEQFFRSYLVGYALVLAIPLGCLCLSMINHMSGGAWGLVARRVWEASSRTLPLMAILVVPLLFGLEAIYAWTDPELVASNDLVSHKAGYLNKTAFIGRMIAYFVVWCIVAFALSSMSRRQDTDPSPALTRRMQLFSAGGMIMTVLAVTFFSFDTLMSLEPTWYSTIYGAYYLAGAALATLAFTTLMARHLSRSEPMNTVFASRHYHDWGKLSFAFIMVWAYFSFSQFLIIWSANLPDEVAFYLHRTQHGWQWWALFLVVAHFAFPFVLLLSRDRKRAAHRLARMAIFILAVRWVDMVWQVVPVFSKDGLSLSWMDVVAPVALGGLFFAYFVRELKARPLLPVGAPDLPEAIGDD